jgi:arginyl-tRNA synthetase
MKDTIVTILTAILRDMNISDMEPEVEMTGTSGHGEYTTNVAMKLTKTRKENPMRIGEDIKKRIEQSKKMMEIGVEKIELASPGFLNFFLSDSALLTQIVQTNILKNPSTIMVEFAHPNTHKAFHIGHLRNIITGESIVRLLKENGHTVIRANYQGDVGLHIAKCLFGILHTQEYSKHLQEISSMEEKIQFLSQSYVAGNKAYEEDTEAKKEINIINKQIYAKDPKILRLYEQTRNWSLEYFAGIYGRVGTTFDRFYFESETYELGKKLVEEYTDKGVFEKSDGAIIFPGEKFGLHNRVFITSEGNPTYEGKDIGLAKLQRDEYHPDMIIHCVASEQIEYFRVIFEAISQVFPDMKGKEYHLVYGWVRLKEGKMSSRSGNVVLGEWLLTETKKEMMHILSEGNRGYDAKEKEAIAECATIAAVKYAFLKVSTPQEIAFDIKESININGDSGPYLLYTYARCKSVVEKSQKLSEISDQTLEGDIKQTLNQEEHDLARLLLYYPEVVTYAANNYAPNALCTYLFILAQAFNLLYAKHPILENNLRLMLTNKTAETLQRGLYLLGIPTVDRM